jgi:CubicO group peptidase (beta-lactamase class C family)
MLFDPDEDVRWAASYALDRIGYGPISRRFELGALAALVDSLLPELMREYHVPGVSITVVDKRTIAWEGHYGVMDSGAAEPVTSQTLFEACSMSKPVLALLVMKLVEQKKLDLDMPLAHYLAERFVSTGDYGGRITARMILCHTAGFPNWRKGEEETGGPLPVYFPPGSRFSYSGEGFYYLQRVVEKLTGEPLDAYARSALFEPLDLKHTSFSWTQEMAPYQARGHDTSGRALDRTQYAHPNAAYSLYTSSEDYAKIICALLGSDEARGFPLSSASKAEMTRPQVRVEVRSAITRPGRALGVGVGWGLGWAIDSTISGNVIYHSGANRSGFRCYSQFNPDVGSGFVIMTNGLNGGELWRRVVEQVGDF